jgi:hypothetical protein
VTRLTLRHTYHHGEDKDDKDDDDE